MTDTSFATWVRDNAVTGGSLDPRAALDDLEPLRKVIGDARVVAIGESAHHVREFYLLRHRLLRFLVERCGFTVYAFEAPFTEARAIDAWVRGGPGTVEEVAGGSGMALTRCQEMYDTLAWMRTYNRTAARPLRFAGTIAGSGGGSPLPELHEVGNYLRWADPDAMPLLEHAVEAAKSYHDAAPMVALQRYATVGQSVRDALTATMSRLLSRMESMRAYQRGRRREREYATALAHLRGAWHLDHFHRDLAGVGLAIGTTSLDAFMAESVLRVLNEAPDTRIALAVHNVHVRKTMVNHDGPVGLFPAGYHLARALGDDYLAIAATSGRGRTAQGRLDPEHPAGFAFRDRPPAPLADGSIEAAFPSEAPVTVADLRTARPVVGDAETFQRVRMEHYIADVPVFDAFDAIAYIPRTSTTEHVDTDRSAGDGPWPKPAETVRAD